MATLSRLEQALINADAAGDTQAASVIASEIRRMRMMPEKSVPTAEQEMRASTPARMVQGVRDLIDAGAQMAVRAVPEPVVNAVNSGVGALNRVPVLGDAMVALGMTPASKEQIDQGIQQNEQQYQEARKATGNTGVDFARVGGNILATVPAAMAIPAGGTLAAKMAVGAGVGGGLGAMQPVTQKTDDFAAQKAEQIGMGALFGGAAAPVAHGLARVIKPNTSPQVQQLMNEGVTPTPGQILGGVARSTEDKMMSVPIVGDAITAARRSAVEDFNRAVYSRSLNPIGGQAPQNVGREGVAAVRDKLSKAYDDLLPQLRFQADDAFNAEIGNLKQMASSLPEQQANRFEQLLQKQVFDKLTPQGLANGARLKEIESQLGKFARGYGKSQDFDVQQLGSALEEVQATIRRALVRTNPERAPELQAINTGWANFARLRNAAARSGSAEGVVTPAQMSASVRATDSSPYKGNFATGNALMQDLSDAGKSVLGNGYPDSGTAGRTLMALAAGGAGYFNPAIPLGLLAGSLPYLPYGRGAMAGLLTQRPEFAGPLAEGVRTLLPPIGAVMAPSLLNR